MGEKKYEIEKYCPRGEVRWRVVDKESGKVLDDAGGWGYKSRQSAHIGWGYKSKSDSEKEALYKKKLAVWKFVEKNEKLAEMMETESFWALKDGEEFGADDVDAILRNEGIESVFTAKEILKAWVEGRPKKPTHMKKAERALNVSKSRKGWKEKENKANAEALEWVKTHPEIKDAILSERASFVASNRQYTATEVKCLFKRMGVLAPVKAKRILKTIVRGSSPEGRG